MQLPSAPPNLVSYQRWNVAISASWPGLSLAYILLLTQFFPLPPDSASTNVKWLGVLAFGFASWLGIAIIQRGTNFLRLILSRKLGAGNPRVVSLWRFAKRWTIMGGIALALLSLCFFMSEQPPVLLLGVLIVSAALLFSAGFAEQERIRAQFEGRIPLRAEVLAKLQATFASVTTPITWYELKSGATPMLPTANVRRLGGPSIDSDDESEPVSYEISISDTMLETFTVEAIEAVCWHELGHAEPQTSMTVSGLSGVSLLVLCGAALFLPFTLGAMTPGSVQAVPLGIIGIGSAYTIWRLVFKALRRREERQADGYAVDHVSTLEVMVEALRKSWEVSGQNARPPWLSIIMLQDHPSLQQRMDFAHRRWQKRLAATNKAA
jgi:Zn-dependent protease with chaperone function